MQLQYTYGTLLIGHMRLFIQKYWHMVKEIGLIRLKISRETFAEFFWVQKGLWFKTFGSSLEA